MPGQEGTKSNTVIITSVSQNAVIGGGWKEREAILFACVVLTALIGTALLADAFLHTQKEPYDGRRKQ
jgi:hypothetical protein